MSAFRDAKVHKNFINRRNGVFKKADSLSREFKVRIVVYVEDGDELSGYQSEKNWPLEMRALVSLSPGARSGVFAC